MNVHITGRNLKITPDVRSYIEKKMKKIDHFIDHVYDFKLTMMRQRHIITAEVNISMKKKIIHIFANTEDIFSVLDTLFDKIDVKLRRSREKLIGHRTTPLRESPITNAHPAATFQRMEESA
jgi:putative sigma-54 modulation protein